jgi:protein gp37
MPSRTQASPEGPDARNTTDRSVRDTPTDHIADAEVHPVPRQPATPNGPGQNDLFHARVPDEFILRVFAVMHATPRHTYQVLTKRSPRLRRLAPRLPWPRNVWMGVSVEDDEHVRRVDDLRQVPAAVRFISAEPLLGPLPSLDLKGVDWLIAGGESGHRARPMDASWVADLRDACTDADVAFFFKQWGGRTPKAGGRELEGRTWDALPLAHSRWPQDNRVKRPQCSAAVDG